MAKKQRMLEPTHYVVIHSLLGTPDNQYHEQGDIIPVEGLGEPADLARILELGAIAPCNPDGSTYLQVVLESDEPAPEVPEV